MSTKTAATRTIQTQDGEVDRFIKESCKSFKECTIKNNVRRNSLQKKTLGIESERKLASANLSREERQLREQLKQMNIEKAKNNLIHNLREAKKHGKKSRKEEAHVIPTEPYPVTFRSLTPSPRLDVEKHHGDRGRVNSARHHTHRQLSKECEDLNHRVSLRPDVSREDSFGDDDDDDFPRRRVYSMSYTQNPRFRKQHGRHLEVSGSDSNPSSPRASPRPSPDLRRRLLSPKLARKAKGSDSSGNSSKESLSGSVEHIKSLDDLHWVGAPEAIHSVRRHRKTAEEITLDSELHKLQDAR